jgi:Ca2+-binding RTX toxin-like protein
MALVMASALLPATPAAAQRGAAAGCKVKELNDVLTATNNHGLNVVTGSGTIQGTGGDDLILGSDGDDVIFGGGGNDIICGFRGADQLFGEGGNDLLKGLAGDDKLYGGAGNDRLEGGAGNDRVDGGAGTNILKGGAGDDVFVFNKTSGMDTVTDFRDGHDRIDVSGLSGVSSLNDLTVADTAHGVVIGHAAAILVLKGVHESDLDNGDFIF